MGPSNLKSEIDQIERTAQVDQANSMIPSLNAYQVKYYAVADMESAIRELKTEVVFSHNALFEDRKLIFQRMFPDARLGPILRVVRAFNSWEELELLPMVDNSAVVQ